MKPSFISHVSIFIGRRKVKFNHDNYSAFFGKLYWPFGIAVVFMDTFLSGTCLVTVMRVSLRRRPFKLPQWLIGHQPLLVSIKENKKTTIIIWYHLSCTRPYVGLSKCYKLSKKSSKKLTNYPQVWLNTVQFFMLSIIWVIITSRIVYGWHQWPLLLTWLNFNPSMDK